MLIAAILGLLTWLGTIQLWHIYLLVGIQAFATSFDGPATRCIGAQLGTRKDLPMLQYDLHGPKCWRIMDRCSAGVVIATLGQQWAIGSMPLLSWQ